MSYDFLLTYCYLGEHERRGGSVRLSGAQFDDIWSCVFFFLFFFTYYYLFWSGRNLELWKQWDRQCLIFERASMVDVCIVTFAFF